MLTTVADGVHVHQSDLLLNNTVVVDGDAGVLLVDPGITAAEMACLAADLSERGRPVAVGFATHPDWDHALWHPAFGDVPRFGTASCAARLADVRADPEWESQVADGLPPEIAEDVPLGLFGLVTGLQQGAGRLSWDGPRSEVIEHPAHAPGHAAILIEERGVLIAGDMLSDVLVPMFDDPDSANDPLGEYLVGLERLEAVRDKVDVLIPGHGSPCDRAEMRNRIELDRAYVHALQDGAPSDDPRIGPDARPGWEWVADISAFQQQTFARR